MNVEGGGLMAQHYAGGSTSNVLYISPWMMHVPLMKLSGIQEFR